MMTKKLWGGRFTKKTHPLFDAFSSSLPVDHKLAAYDLKASEVHCRMLARTGVMDARSARKIIRALQSLAKNLPRYQQVFLGRDYEDIHSWIEHELIRKVGEAAKRIHAGRSRNDQVNQATRMYCKDKGAGLVQLVSAVQKALLHKAKQYPKTVMAGMTHLQKAQPVLVGHVFLSYVESLDRSKDRLKDALKRVDTLTLGSGALAGTSLPIDREWVQKQLGFGAVSQNSLDAVGSRDFVAEFVFVIALLGAQLSRIAEDLILGQMEDVGIYELPNELCTGSSMMPQKKNPDFLELVRGASSILTGNATSLLVLLKGTPGSYNRDLQWDKGPLFQSVEVMEEMLSLLQWMFKGLKVNVSRAKASLANDQLCATDLAEALVLQGLAFRTAHERVGKFVVYCERHGLALKEAPPSVVERMLGKKIPRLAACLDPERSVELKQSRGSTRPSEVRKAIQRWEKKIHASV